MTADSASAFFVTGGTLRPDAPCYLERQADRDLLEALLRGEFCYVLTSRQMGKSSLMVRAAVKLRERGVHVVVLDLSAIGQNVDPEQWHNGLLAGIARQLRLEKELEDFWSSHVELTPMQRLVYALRDVALVRCPGSLVLFIDELDVVRSLPFKTDEFFAAIRACANQRAEDGELQRLTFCLLGVASPSDLIQDPRITPFNIGRRIELHDFTPSEAAPLAKGLETPAGHPAAAETALQRILHWTNGHPYLTQRLCKAVAAGKESGAGPATSRRIHAMVDSLCAELFLTDRAREQDDNLVFVRDRILRLEMDRAALLHLYQEVLRRAGAPDNETNPPVAILRLAGIVRRDGGRLRVRNRIYAHAFNRRWIEANMPDAEMRRQREAYRRGVVRTATVAAAVVSIMAALVVLALRSRAHARNATWTALRDQARLSRSSALPGQRFSSLELIRRATRIKASPELRDEAIACLASPDLQTHPSPARLDPNATALVFSEDLRFYAFATPVGDIVLRRLEGNQELARWRTDAAPPARIWLAPDPQYLMLAHTAGQETTLAFWHCSPPERLFALTNRMPVTVLDFSPDGHQVAFAGPEDAVRILNLPGGNLHAEAGLTGSACSSLSYDPKGRWLAVASANSLSIQIYSAATGGLIRRLHSASPATHLAWYPDGQLLAAAGEDRRIRLWEIEADEFPRQEIPAQPSDITALAFSRSGSLLASACANEMVRFWEPGNARLLLTAPVSGTVPQLRFGPDDRQLGFALSDREIYLWQIATGEECRTLFDFEADDLTGLDIHPEGDLLATAHRNGVSLWDLRHGRLLARMPVGATAAVRFQPLSGDLVTSEFRGTYCFKIERQAQTNELVLQLKPKEDFYLGPAPKALDFARDVDVLAVAYEDRIRLVRNTNSAYGTLGELIGEPGFASVALSPDGRLLAAGNWKTKEVWTWDRGEDATPRRWNVEGRAEVRFSPDGRWLAVGTEQLASFWDTRAWRPVVKLERPAGAVRPAPMAFAKDGKLWAVALSDTRIRILDPHGKSIADLESPHQQSVVGLVFSPDSSRLVCATAARTIFVWNLNAVVHTLAQLQLDFGLSLAPLGAAKETPPLAVKIGAFDRLRFSPARHLLGVRREIGDLTDMIRRNPGAWLNYQKRAERYRDLGEYDKAIADYEQWIELDKASASVRSPQDRAWPLRDLATIYLSRSKETSDYEKALSLTQAALKLDAQNVDNQFRHGLACYRLGQYEAADASFEVVRRAWTLTKKNLAVVLFYQAMCQARQNKRALAAELLERARQHYGRTDLKYRESHVEELADLLWEAERVVSGSDPGG